MKRTLWLTPLLAAATAALVAMGLLLVFPHKRSPAPGAQTTATNRTPASELRPPPNPMLLRGLPDSKLTPGEIGTGAPRVTPELQWTIFSSYGIDAEDKRYVLCPVIPRSLGGALTQANLFPATQWFAGLKARTDATLTTKVRGGKLTAAQAVEQLKGNWIAAAHRNHVRNYGQQNAAKVRVIEGLLKW